jgi:hypothetical protein
MKNKKINHALICKTITFFNKFSGIDFLLYKNCEGKLYFIELSKPYSDYGGYQAIIVCADDLKILGKTHKQVHLSLIARSFYEFPTMEDFEKQYSKIHLLKLEHGIEFYK